MHSSFGTAEKTKASYNIQNCVRVNALKGSVLLLHSLLNEASEAGAELHTVSTEETDLFSPADRQ